jgi:hypothetical protein
MRSQLFLCIAFMHILMSSSFAYAMDYGDAICIRVKDGICPVKKNLIPLIGGLAAYHHKYGTDIAKNRKVPVFNIEKNKLDLVCKALYERPDTFDTFYHKLSREDQKILVECAGFCEQRSDKKNVMLHVPEIGKRIIEVDRDRFPADIKKLIKYYAGNRDENFVRAYCKARLLCDNFLGLKKVPCVGSIDNGNSFPSAIEWDSLFLNGHFVHNKPLSPISLYIGSDVYQTFKYNFVTDNYEFRVTAPHTNRFSQAAPLFKQCCVWVINHDNPALRCSVKIAHQSNIIGCCFSKTGTDTEYVVTYSKRDLVFSKIIKATDGSSSIESIHAVTPDNGIIVSACFNHLRNELNVVTHEAPTEDQEPHTASRGWNMNGICSQPARFYTKDYGSVQNIFVTKDSSGSDVITLIFAIGSNYTWIKYNDLQNLSYSYLGATSRSWGIPANRYWGTHIELKQGSSMVYDFCCSPFAAKQKLKAQNAQDGWLKSWKNDFCFEPDQQKMWTYSPDGTLLMSNSLEVKGGSEYIVTRLQDARTHQYITECSTIAGNCEGVGFTDSGDLVFLNLNICNEKISVSLDSETTKTLKDFENLTCNNGAVASVIARLCRECQKSGYISLHQCDSIRQMLTEWAHTSENMKKFLVTCLPLQVLKSKK